MVIGIIYLVAFFLDFILEQGLIYRDFALLNDELIHVVQDQAHFRHSVVP